MPKDLRSSHCLDIASYKLLQGQWGKVNHLQPFFVSPLKGILYHGLDEYSFMIGWPVCDHMLVCWTSLFGHSSLCTQRSAGPPCSAQTSLCSALCLMDYLVRTSFTHKKTLKWSISNKGQLALLNFPKEVRKRQKLMVILSLMVWFIYFLNMSKSWIDG